MMKKNRFKLRHIFNSINAKIAIVFMLMLLATIEVIGAYFTRQVEQSTIENFQNSIQIPTVVTNQLAAQLGRNTDESNSRMNQIIADYNNDTISQIIVVDNKNIVRAVSNFNDKSRVGQRINNMAVRQVTSTGRQSTQVVNEGASYMVQISPLTSSNNSNNSNVVGAIYVRASMQNVFDTMRNISTMFLVTSIVAAVFGAFLSLIISRAITSPIKAMQDQASNIADGDYSNQVKIYSDDEIGQLGKVLNTLSIRIERSQEESDSERRRLDSVLSHMSDGVLATDRHGNVIIANQMALNFLDITEDKIINKPIANVLGIRDESSGDLISSPQDLMVTINANTSDETILNVSFSLIKRVTGFVSGAVCVLHDITEQQHNEDEQRQFVSNVSHELRTPLTSLRAYIEALNEGAWKDPKIAPKFLNVTQQETERMIRMINDLLSLSRMDRGVAKMDLEWVNLNDFLSHVLNRFDMIVKTDNQNTNNKKYSIKREFSKQDLWVEIDTDKMMQVIDNIMNNAIKYSPDGGVITVKLQQNQNQVILSIKDQGLGIPRKDLTKVFERFYRVDKARSRQQGGTGLGLAISKEIVEAHHGRLWADSKEGHGSTFYIALPYEPMSEEDDWDEV